MSTPVDLIAKTAALQAEMLRLRRDEGICVVAVVSEFGEGVGPALVLTSVGCDTPDCGLEEMHAADNAAAKAHAVSVLRMLDSESVEGE